MAKRNPCKSAQPKNVDKGRRGIAEWAVTILLLLFATTTLCQAFVIPTGSMEDTLLVGDHLLVDKLAYASAGPIAAHLLPYEEPKHGDIIVFRYPPDINQTLVKRGECSSTTLCFARGLLFYRAAARPGEVVEGRIVRILVNDVRLVEPLAVSIYDAVAYSDTVSRHSDEALFRDGRQPRQLL